MQFHIVVVATAILLSVMADDGAEQDSGTHALVELGSVDGKTYYYDKPVGRNWTEARTYCISKGMKLATIDTPSHVSFLESKYNSSTFSGWYWTSARDAQTARQFSWDESENALTDSIGLEFEIARGLEYQTCILYWSSSTPKFTIQRCAAAFGSTLCET